MDIQVQRYLDVALGFGLAVGTKILGAILLWIVGRFIIRGLLSVLHSRVVRVLSFPPLTFGLFVISPWALYFSGWYEATLRSTYVHEMMHVHLVTVGALFLWPLVGVDPVPGRVAYPFRMLLMAMTLPFHAFLGVTIMNQTTLLGGDWYPSLDRAAMPWLPTQL